MAHQVIEMIKSENGFRGSSKIPLGEEKGKVAPNKHKKRCPGQEEEENSSTSLGWDRGSSLVQHCCLLGLGACVHLMAPQGQGQQRGAGRRPE